MSESERPVESPGVPQRRAGETGMSLVEWRERLAILTARPPEPARFAVVVVVVLAAVTLGILLVRRQAPPPELNLPMAGSAVEAAIASTTTTVPPDLVVHAAGEVRHPGVYRVPSPARVMDLIDRAGGPTEAAQLHALNLAAVLVDGQRVYIPRVGEVDPGGVSGDPSMPAGPGRVINLNTAGVEELDTLPGIGPATARAIIEERGRRGRFDSVEDLLDVRGIGEAKLAEIRPLVRV